MESSRSKANILVVDDQPESLLAVEAVLSELGENIVAARSGQEALLQMLKNDFAVVLLDVQMPGVNGFEVAALMREREKTRHTPIIFMTAAFTGDASVFKGYEVGAVDYIFKPVVPEILRAKVSVFVELERREEMIRQQRELLWEAERREHERRMEEALSFTHAVSHELRAPLRHIQSFSEILIEAYAGRLGDDGRSLLNRISGAANELLHLIDALLKFSEATRAHLRARDVDMSRLVAGIAVELKREEPSRNVEFDVQKGLAATGDPEFLRVAMENLLRNAWKFTAKKTVAHIAFGSSDGPGGAVYFVRDDGAGFSMEDAGKLFKPFSRLHARQDFEGTGVGLATVGRIIERHGGRIWAEGRVGGGATFFFTLHARAVDGPEPLIAG
jgi:signal transduction histidine kinase